MNPIIDIIAGPVFKLIDKIIPDKAQADKAKLEALQLQQDGHFKELELALEEKKLQNSLDLEQGKINEIEAASPNFFKSGWRPFVGWICGLALLSDFIVRPYVDAFTHVTIPTLDMGTLIALLSGLLGLGSLRTLEKIKGA